MIRFPNAKINIGLHVLGRREDGYHALETWMLPTGFTDLLEVLPTESKGLQFSLSGIPLSIDGGTNICEKAYDLLASRAPIGGVQVHLHKQIPAGAGLGGGSADGTFILKMLNELFVAGCTLPTLEQLASQLGSDCPFFVQNSPSMVTGRGEILEPFGPDLSGVHLVILLPSFRISTSWAYQQIVPNADRPSLKTLLMEPVEVWRTTIVNDFEKVVFSRYPEAAKVKEELYRCGAVYSQMSGSGSAFFGLFKTEPSLSPGLQKICLYSGPMLHQRL